MIGDAVATIVMSLLDDMNSQNHIHTLRMHVSQHLHRERNERLGEDKRGQDASREANAQPNWDPWPGGTPNCFLGCGASY